METVVSIYVNQASQLVLVSISINSSVFCTVYIPCKFNAPQPSTVSEDAMLHFEKAVRQFLHQQPPLQSSAVAPVLKYLQPDDVSARNLSLELAKVLEKVDQGLETHAPVLSEEGEGGTYFMRDATGCKVAVFKPVDEEADCAGNPKRLLCSGSCADQCQPSGSPVRAGIPTGEGALREVAAYLLDQQIGAGVPPTVLVKCVNQGWFYSPGSQPLAGPFPKVKFGSLQEYVEHECSSEDMSCKFYNARQVHRIGVLDLCLLNTDRHSGNLLVACGDTKGKGSVDLVPIDHGLCLPETLADLVWFEWMSWPQSREAFDDDTKLMVATIDVDKFVEVLADLGFSARARRTFRIGACLVRNGVALGLTLYQIGQIACSGNPDTPSPLYTVFQKLPDPCDEDDRFDETLVRALLVPLSAVSTK